MGRGLHSGPAAGVLWSQTGKQWRHSVTGTSLNYWSRLALCLSLSLSHPYSINHWEAGGGGEQEGGGEEKHHMILYSAQDTVALLTMMITMMWGRVRGSTQSTDMLEYMYMLPMGLLQSWGPPTHSYCSQSRNSLDDSHALYVSVSGLRHDGNTTQGNSFLIMEQMRPYKTITPDPHKPSYVILCFFDSPLWVIILVSCVMDLPPVQSVFTLSVQKIGTSRPSWH